MKRLLIAAILLLPWFAQAQWTSINPGAGGQVQDVVADPNINERLILASDMEGIYESLNNGESWKPKGELHQNRVYAVAIPKQSGNQKMYVGTLFGLEVSNDSGNTFTLIDATKKKSIGAIAIHPTNKNIVLAAVGWKDDYDDAGGGNRFYSLFGMSKGGKVTVFKSTDGGVNWTEKTTANTYGDRNVFAIKFNPKNGSEAFLASDAGIFRSTNTGDSWSRLSAPNGTNGRAKGVDISPDGKVVYAVYLTDAAVNNGRDQGEDLEAAVFASRISSINWKNVTGSLPNYSFWQPEVDPFSTGHVHKVIVSMDQERKGLYQATVTWNDTYSSATPASTNWAQIWTENDVVDGWDVGKPNARFAHYTPKGNGWARAIWTTQNQTIYRGDLNGSSYNWHNRYSYTTNQFFADYWGIPVATYGTRGTESTYTWDIDAHANYVIQGMGDNGPVESWDGGETWSNVWMRQNGFLSDVQAVEIADAWGKKVVIAQMAAGFGGHAGTGNLYVKHLDNYSPNDEWEFYAGGSEYRGGLPNGLISDIAESPAAPGTIFVFSRGNGLYMQDFGWAYNDKHLLGDQPWFSKISNGIADQISSVKKIAPHPTNPNIVYVSSVSGSTGVFKGVNNGGNWTWSKIYNGGGWDAEVYAWDNAGQTVLFYSGKSYEDGDGENFVGAISLDEGNTWKTVLKSHNTRAVVSHSWYNKVTSGPNAYGFKFQNKGGLVGYDNKVIMAHYDHTLQKTYAVLEGTISGSNTSNASVSWSDITGNLPFGGLTTARVVANGNDKYLYVSTAGAGAWRKTLGGSSVVTPSSVSIGNCPAGDLTVGDTASLSASVQPANATNKAVSWSSSNSNVATVSSSGAVSAVAAGSATITVTTQSGNKTDTCGITVVAPPASGAASITVRARMALGSSDSLQLRVDNQVVHTWTISGSSYANYTTSKVLNGNVKLYFPDNGTDMEIDYLKVNDTTYQAEAQAINTSAWMNGSCGGGGYTSIMHCPGHIDFGTINAGSNPGNVSVTGVQINNCNNPSISVGGSVDLNETVSPTNATNKTVSWSSANTGVATVNSSGVVSGQSAGNATITVTSQDGGFTASCSVAVTNNQPPQTGYRYLMLYGYGTVLNDTTIQQIHWMVNGYSYPDPKLTWNTKSQVTSSTNGTNDYAAYDVTNVGWVIGRNFPAWIKIDLGAGNEIAPDAIMIKPNADDRGFSSFEAFGSNDNSNWTSLHSRSGLTSADYSGLTTFEFSN
ncbi:Ig-like domain-containing protein [Simiduia agarivorans]|uniref:Beta-agarase n=1 Tax=Simiduia agarivorans (strain DSM 21679 / JCM 13881 / BCRC 17597 / SA1) TaxID=1117647 RepID=K4KQB1_SIMAS|nr:Ig-like domain-containing protein [Simiduia agarivorans]AFV00461.1 putative beta-agarase precursor [Simiduia agarivorans SA1 = DSM 21679]